MAASRTQLSLSACRRALVQSWLRALCTSMAPLVRSRTLFRHCTPSDAPSDAPDPASPHTPRDAPRRAQSCKEPGRARRAWAERRDAGHPLSLDHQAAGRAPGARQGRERLRACTRRSRVCQGRPGPRSRPPAQLVVDFWATWCGPCRMMTPVLIQLAETFGDRCLFVKIDVDRAEVRQEGRHALRCTRTPRQHCCCLACSGRLESALRAAAAVHALCCSHLHAQHSPISLQTPHPCIRPSGGDHQVRHPGDADIHCVQGRRESRGACRRI